MTVAGIAIAGALGALARYGVGVAFGPRRPDAFPVATFLINVSGSLALGFLVELFTVRYTNLASLRTSITVGFLGAYTTFSTFSLETMRLIQFGAPTLAAVYVASSVVAGVIFAAAGSVLGGVVARAV